MSSHPHEPSGAMPNNLKEQPAVPVQAKKKLGCGCPGSITGAILLVLAVSLLLDPWALRIGGRWTPALTWHGIGKLHATTGATYGLYMEVSLYTSQGRGRSGKNLAGTAKLCTPQGEIYPLTVDGYLKRAWLDAEGKPVTFYFYSLKNAQPRLRLELLGSWQGQELVLDDKGSMAMSFAADGRAKGYLQGQNAPMESATGRLHYATESAFASACGEKNPNSF